MKAFSLLAIVILLSACGLTKVTTQHSNGYTFKTFKDTDNSLVTYVKVNDSIAVAFRSQSPPGSPGDDIDINCLLCVIQNINSCAKEVCPGNEGHCSDQIRECANAKCQASGECKITAPKNWGIIRIL